MIKKLRLIIKLIPSFLGLCFRYPLTIRENFSDVYTMYLILTDKELINITNELEEYSNKN
jgi:hypothetical protein